MPPDRVFGQIEQILRKKENIVSPKQYHEVFEKLCSVKVYNKNFLFYDYKTAAKKLVKSKTDFKSTQKKKNLHILKVTKLLEFQQRIVDCHSR